MAKFRIIAVPAAIALALMGSAAPKGPEPQQPATKPVSDFNGDGFSDLVVGVPFEDVAGIQDAGSVNVIYGSADGLTAQDDQAWNQDSSGIGESAERSDQFGFATAAGDFNGDGFDDLVVGVPLEDSPEDSGVVNVINGSPDGLTATGNRVWSQDSGGILGTRESGDGFGRALATGDFNHDTYVDLAIGVPFEDVDRHVLAGSVNVIYGSAGGLTAGGNQLWTQDSSGILGSPENGDMFGFSLTTGDLNGDTFDDLAVGDPFENVGSKADAGAVNVIYGSAGGLSSSGDQLWTQDNRGIGGSAESGDLFGYSLAGGDFDHDDFADLAVGVPFEDAESRANTGAVNVIYGSAGGLTSSGEQLWTQDTSGILGSAEARDEFGFALATGDFDANGSADLAIGVPGEDPPTNAGAVNVIYGGPPGLSSSGDQLWVQGKLSANPGEAGDRFGFSLAAGRFGKDPPADLAIGVPAEDFSGKIDAGGVNVAYGTTGGLRATGAQFWTQDLLAGPAERGDQFAYGQGGHPAG
jgi:hypothetical protein